MAKKRVLWVIERWHPRWGWVPVSVEAYVRRIEARSFAKSWERVVKYVPAAPRKEKRRG